jgi:hypothetical protein
MLLHLPPVDDPGQPRAKNGPPLAGHGAEAVRDAIVSSITTLPELLRRSLTWDQGAEMAQHAQLRVAIGLPEPVPDAHVRDTEFLRQAAQRPASPGELDHPGTELRGVRRLEASYP